MGRVTVYVNDELLEAVMAKSPGLNKSEAFQLGLRAALECDHLELACTCCGQVLSADAVAGPRLAGFFVSVMNRFRSKLDDPKWAQAARVVHQAAADHGVPGVTGEPVPRAVGSTDREDRRREAGTQRTIAAATARAALEAERVVTQLPLEADSRRRHPTATEATA